MAIKRDHIYLLILWILCVFPMTFLGFGSDEDAWQIAGNAETIWETGEYHISRTTGFPLHELLLTPLIMAGNWYFANWFHVLAGLVLIAGFVSLGKVDNFRYPLLTIIGFMFLPVILKNSSSTIDYIPSLALLVWSYVSLRKGKLLLSAALIGIACGFRPTNCMFIFPTVYLIVSENGEGKTIFKFILTAFFIGLIAYSPVLLKHGIPNPYRPVEIGFGDYVLIGGYRLLQLFGILPSLALGAVVILRMKKIYHTARDDNFLLFHLINMAVWLGLFCLLPDEPEYLMPMVPSAMMIIDRVLNRKVMLLTVILLISYNVFRVEALGGVSGERKIEMTLKPGLLVQDIQDRIFKLSFREIATDYQPEEPTILMLGHFWTPVLNDKWVRIGKEDFYRRKEGNFYLSTIITDEEQLQNWKSEGFRIVVWNKWKMGFMQTDPALLDRYIDVIDDLEDFFGKRIAGQARYDI